MAHTHTYIHTLTHWSQRAIACGQSVRLPSESKSDHYQRTHSLTCIDTLKAARQSVPPAAAEQCRGSYALSAHSHTHTLAYARTPASKTDASASGERKQADEHTEPQVHASVAEFHAQPQHQRRGHSAGTCTSVSWRCLAAVLTKARTVRRHTSSLQSRKARHANITSVRAADAATVKNTPPLV